MKLSSYSYLFAARKNQFDLDGMVANFTAFFDESVIATIPYDDDTHSRLLEWEAKSDGKLKVIMVDIDINKSNRWDGDLKTAALQACTKSTKADPRCYVIADGDERFPLSNRPKWIDAANRLHETHLCDGLLIPVLDLIQDEHHIKAEENVGVKFRLHKDTVVRRGVVPEAEMGYNNLFDATRSDSTEPLTELGQLATFFHVIRDVHHLWPQGSVVLNQYPYVVHYGHLDADRRARLNREFWREHWRNRSGQEPNMVLDAEKLKSVKVVRHQVAIT